MHAEHPLKKSGLTALRTMAISFMFFGGSIPLEQVSAGQGRIRGTQALTLVLPIGHTRAVTAVTFSPANQKLAVSAGIDGTLKFWDLEQKRLIRTIQGEKNARFNAVAFSPDGKYVLSQTEKAALALWDAETGQSKQSLSWQTPYGSVHFRPIGADGSVGFSPDGRLIFAAGGEGLGLWDAHSYELVRTLADPLDLIIQAAISPDGQKIAAVAVEQVKLWDVRTGALLRTWRVDSNLRSIAFSSDGKSLITSSTTGSVSADIWDADTGAHLRSLGSNPTTGIVAASPRDGAIACGDANRTKIYLRDGRILNLEGHADWIKAIAFASDGSQLLSGSNDGSLKLWNATTGELISSQESFSAPVRSVVFSPDGKLLASASKDGWVRIWSPSSGSLMRAIPAHKREITSLTFSQDSKLIATSSYDGLAVLEASTGTAVRSFSQNGNTYAVIAPDATFLASGSKDGDVTIWDLTTTHSRSFAIGTASAIRAMAISPNSRFLAAASEQRVVIWDLKSGKTVGPLDHTDTVLAIVFNSDGGVLVSAGGDSGIKLWNARSGTLSRDFGKGSTYVQSLALSSDNQWLVSASQTKTVKLWELTGQAVKTFDRHSGFVRSVAVDPTGRLLASGGDDGAIKLWDGTKDEPVGLYASADMFLAVTRAGFFNGTPQSARALSIRHGASLYPIDRVFGALQKPDLIEELLRGDPTGKYANAAMELDLVLGKALGSSPAEKVELGLPDRPSEKSRTTLVLEDPGGGRRAESRIMEASEIEKKALAPDAGEKENEIALGNAPPAAEIIPQIGHSASVSCVAVTPDGKYVVSGSEDHTIKIWELATGRLLRSLEGHSDDVRAIAVTPDSNIVVSGGDDNAIKIWQLATGKLLRSFEGHDRGGVTAIQIAHDGRYFVSGGGDNIVKLWELGTGKLIKGFVGHSDSIRSIAMTPDGRRIVSSGDFHSPGDSRDGFRLWNVETGDLVRTFQGHSDRVNALAISPDGRRVISASDDETLMIWGLETGKRLHRLEGHISRVVWADFSPNGQTVVSGDDENKIALWNAGTGKLIRILGGYFSDFKGELSYGAVVTRDGRYVLSSNGVLAHSMGSWDLKSLRLVRDFDGLSQGVLAVAFAPSGHYFTTGGRDGIVRVWETATGKLVREIDDGSGAISSLAVTPDSRRLLAGSWDKKVRLWDFGTGKLVRMFEGDSGAVTSVLTLPDGNRFMSGSRDKTVKLWDIETGAVLRTFEGHTGYISSIAVTPDARELISGSSDGTIVLWDVETGSLLRSIKEGSSGIFAVAITPNGRSFVSGSWGGLKLWDVATGDLLLTLDKEDETIRSLAISPDGRYLLADSKDNVVKLWDLESEKFLGKFKAHSGHVNSLAISPTEPKFLSGSDDGSVKLAGFGPSRGGEIFGLATFAARRGEWLTMTMPEGFFSSSPNGSEQLSIVRGMDGLGVDQMFQTLFSPDLVREKLGGDPDGEVKEAEASVNLAAVLDSGRPPSVRLLSPAPTGTAKNEVITAEARIKDEGGQIGRIEWRVNGTTVGIAHGAAGPGKEQAVRQDLALEDGENAIEVIAYNGRNQLASLPARATVQWKAAPNQPGPKLLVIAVGIDGYADRQFGPLSLAVRDAEAFGAAMQAAGKGGRYAEVDVTTVVKDATAEHIERAIDAMVAKMHPRDTFIFFAAAHGKAENGRFYLIPQDFRSGADNSVVAGGIGQDRLQDWFARIKARRALILLDTCESGALVATRPSGVDAASSEAAVGRLNEATGRPVLTAAAATQPALERKALGHGVFTYALLDALVKGDRDRNGTIELSELVDHIQSVTPEISQKMQSQGAAAVSRPSNRGAVQLGDAPIVSRYAAFRQKPKLGSRGENFTIVNTLSSLPAEAQ